ncbi:MAG TPA: hypothetical protein VGP82_24100 [Ktedonobacterales bacterium]|nr:hypothetical protein [Ktedonobacterales bacterium]
MSSRSPDDSALSTSDPKQSAETLDQARTTSGAGLLLRVDGLFEAILGALLILSPFIGLYDALDLPAPAVQPVVVIVGLLLLPLLPMLWRASGGPRREFVRALAIANGVSALVFVLWVLIWNRSFHPAGAAFVLVVAGILAVLAVLQARAALAG